MLATQCALSIAQVAAQLAPVPYIRPVVQTLTIVFQVVEAVRVNRSQWMLLRDQCMMVLQMGAQAIGANDKDHPSFKEAAQKLKNTLVHIAVRIEHYNNMHNMIAFMKYRAISDKIRSHFQDLDECLHMFSFSTDVARAQWESDFEAVRE
ncbi:Serine/Threonine-kinase TNNI3K [Rhizoctonia solani AG-3 Rhs1AP]|uniref:Serine/Threonine-kinase TNNI3K n=2 Tax=Rhizoctonia solani AG-3 TaxID=1086053 RepID=A0A074S787_9AGAM|nr:Serine/Threonine-kinase TNNI3K [Rhizoctonia solani AG-3 Rhs1AP]KEP45937.1 Serine/Threonine-kinase TNNI3K [Rhizoctonia solani 123E]